MMSAHIVFSSGIVKRFGVMVSNTVMFGSSSLLLLFGFMPWSDAFRRRPRRSSCCRYSMSGAQRRRSFCCVAGHYSLSHRRQSGPTTTSFPVCTVLLAYVCMGEPLGLSTVLGGIMVIIGAEVVRRPQRFSLPALTWAKSALPALENSKGPTP